jgi:hypothetical protein
MPLSAPSTVVIANPAAAGGRVGRAWDELTAQVRAALEEERAQLGEQLRSLLGCLRVSRRELGARRNVGDRALQAGPSGVGPHRGRLSEADARHRGLVDVAGLDPPDLLGLGSGALLALRSRSRLIEFLELHVVVIDRAERMLRTPRIDRAIDRSIG